MIKKYCPKLTVIDSIMGSGKTTWAIDYIKIHEEKPILYITPFLNECERIKNATAPEREFIMPMRKWPTVSKLDDISTRIEAREDIAASHELFKRFDDNVRFQLLFNAYTLIIDEVVDVISPYNISKQDINILIDSNVIIIDEKGLCHWNKEKANAIDYTGRFEDIYQVASTNNLICVNNTFFLWRYDPEIFTLFDEIYVMTYLFDGSIMKAYFDFFDIKYKKVTLQDGKLTDYVKEDRSIYKDLINIYEGNLNDGFTKSAMSKSWYMNKTNEKYIKQIKNNMDNYFKNIIKSSKDTRLWSTFEDVREQIQSSRYKGQFIPCNSRATNEYAEKCDMAYLVNVYIHPGILLFFSSKNIVIDRDLYALGVLLQWIWRSRIRNYKSINIYIPSKRMRNLLEMWMNNII